MEDFDSHAYTPAYPGPNTDLLEAQARVCTGPHQTRPLGINPSDSPQPEPLLEAILKSIAGGLPETETASAAQMGAFFAAMTLRAYFPKTTQWSPPISQKQHNGVRQRKRHFINTVRHSQNNYRQKYNT